LIYSVRAIELYHEEFQKSHSKHGHGDAGSITWLSLLAIGYAKQGNNESTTKANHLIKSSIFEILRHEKNAQKLYDLGASLAEIYLKAGLKTDAEQLARQLRSQAIFGESDIGKSLNLAPGTKLDKRTWVFLVSFESTLAGKREIYSWEMANLIRTVFMYGAYTHAVSQKSPFLPTLIYGSLLLQFTKDIGDATTPARVEKEVLEYFSVNLKAPSTFKTTALPEFFHVVLVEVHKIDHDVSILRAGLATVQAYVSKGKFQEAYELGLLVDNFQTFLGGYNSLEKIHLGLELALVLGGRTKTHPDQKLRVLQLEVSNTIMKQIMKFVRGSQVDIIEIPLKELNDACGLLGDQKNLDELEVSEHYYETDFVRELTSNFSGSSPSSGTIATLKRLGRLLSSSASAVASSKRDSHAATTKKLSTSLKTCATTCVVSGVHSTPQPSRCMTCSPPSILQSGTTGAPC
jgi:hypothetical protein